MSVKPGLLSWLAQDLGADLCRLSIIVNVLNVDAKKEEIYPGLPIVARLG